MKSETIPDILLVGFGNPAREDDGLGPAAADELEKYNIEGLTVDANYQLSVEDAADAAEHDIVIFVDASIKGDGPFEFFQLEPVNQQSFSSHSVEPAGVLGMAKELFNSKCRGYMMGIRGYSFEMFTEVMTEKAGENLKLAVDFLVRTIKNAGKGSLDNIGTVSAVN